MIECSNQSLKNLLAAADAMSPADQEIFCLCVAAYAAGKAAAQSDAEKTVS